MDLVSIPIMRANLPAVDHAGRKVMRIRDLNDERPTSAIFRDSKLEPLKISVTPSIARDRVLLSPDEIAGENVCSYKIIL